MRFVSLLKLQAALFSAVLLAPAVTAQAPAADATFKTLAVRPQARVSARVDNKVRTTLPGHVPLALQHAQETGRLDPGIRMDHMLMVLRPDENQEQALRTLTDQQNEKASPLYHQWMTPEQFGSTFGIDDADINAVTSWLQSEGMTIDQVTPGKRIIEFSGTVGQVETAFQTEMHGYSLKGVSHVSVNSDISIPSALATVVAAVPTLHNFFKHTNKTPTQIVQMSASRFPGLRDQAKADGVTLKPETTFSGNTHGFGPTDFQVVYNSAPLISAGINGTGITIGVLARTDIGLNDIQTYRTLFGLPNNDPIFTVVGEDPGVVAGDDGESYLDVEVAGGVAPNANVNFITSKATLTTDGVDLSAIYAVQNNKVDVITESYGQCEANFAGSSAFQFYNDLWGQAAAQGISVFVSSGDNGPAGCDGDNDPYVYDGYAVSLLASSPFNVAVGGSMFYEGTGTYWGGNSSTYESALSYIPEQPWNESLKNSAGYAELCSLCSGSGGVSAYFALPSYQRGVGINPAADPAYPNVTTTDPASPFTAGPHRLLPDVSLNAAGGHDGTITCEEGACQLVNGGFLNVGVVGGTSVAAPEMAGVQALIDQANGGRQGNPNFHYYALAAANAAAGLNCAATGPPAAGCAFHDVVTGDTLLCDNSGCTKKVGWSATAGYDEGSGLGSANVYNMASQWNSVTFTSSTTSLSASPTAGVTHGQGVMLNVKVAAGTGTGTPTGQVAFFASTGTLGDPVNLNTEGFANQPAYCNLSGGTCTVSVGSLPAGTYTLTARYSGDTIYGSSSSAGIPFTVAKENSTTTLAANTFSCSTGAITPITSVPYGTPFLIDTTVAGNSGQGAATGTISLIDGSTTILTPALNAQGISEVVTGAITSANGFSCLNGYLSNNLPSPLGGAHLFKAAYAGDSNLNGSTSGTAGVTVTPVALTTSLKAASAGIASGASENLYFLLTPLDASAQAVNATGSVTFTDTTSGTPLGTANVVKGTYANVTYFLATLNTTGITAAGSNAISATYTGDNNYATSSATTTVTVGAASTLTNGTMTASANPGTVATADTITFTAAYTGTAPTGTVSFYNGTTLLASSTLSSSTHTATFSTRSILGAGAYLITATYSGSTTYQAYTTPAANALALNISPATPTVDLSVKAGTTLGAPVTAAMVLTVPAPTSGASYNVPYIAPTGKVQFLDNGNPLGSPVALTPTVSYASGGDGILEYVLTTTALSAGSHTITATYQSDPNYNSVTSNPQTVSIVAATPTLALSVPATVYARGTVVPLTAVFTTPTGTPAPTANVTFYDNGNALGNGTLSSSGASTYSVTYNATLGVGTHSLTVISTAETNYNSVSSAPVVVTVTANNVWIVNGNGTVSGLTSTGSAVTGSALPGGGVSIAIDNAGDIWSLNTGGNSVAEFSSAGTVLSSGYTGGGINTPTALAIDGAGLVWITNGNNTLSVLSASGTPLAPTAITSVLSTPSTVNIDASGSLWITNAGDGSLTQVLGVATPVITPTTTAVKNNQLAARP